MSSSRIRSRRPDFGRLAAEYDRIRPLDDNWWRLFEALVAAADVRGRRVLDVGCGTGRLASALDERAGSRVWGVDPSPEMLAEARATAPRSVGFKRGSAESLPFRDEWFDRVVMRLVIHLVDREQAFREVRRVLAPDGMVAIATFDPRHFDRYWLNGLFPSIEPIDRARFPTGSQLEQELTAAGFSGVRLQRVSQCGSLSREDALERIQRRHISTFDLLDDEEIAAGTERAERELPDRVEYSIEWLLAVAER
jgi:ubiquinone/menaquinone biosynthesis C-methylase UbiE